MGDLPLSRRDFLIAAGAGVFGTYTGSAPQGKTTGSATETSTSAVAPRRSSDDSKYDSAIDAVALVRAFGVENPVTGQERRGQGSAFVINDTSVVTNEHVVSGAERVDIQYTTGEWTSAEIVGTDMFADLAILDVDHVPESVRPLQFSLRPPQIGTEVSAIGSPFGLKGSMSKGIISGVNRTAFNPITGVSIPNAVQTDAAVNPGNSGGPLVNTEGSVVGVISAGGAENIGFAISAALSRRVIPSLIENGQYHHPFLGVDYAPVGPLVAEANDLTEPNGVIVVTVIDDGPAEGILRASDETVERRGVSIPVGSDIILEVDGVPVRDRNELLAHLSLETSPGETIPLTIYRNGITQPVELTLGTRPTPS
ncbi:serine protease [Halogeometricum borinquense DSM 11551]|uniref:Serine protease n=2 Tax=Halogeometricum borinquense TaxID=60847 RepID=E4NNK1_HALBP|nr:trypsin-like peptidase domain-containing protein [Halogeometricum borinquense]ADQ66355.1 trypsin-like serine protease with C-terminal PDZ domain [Halogeometricum borinquense DSM 11551]ELY27655.1 serine protease [Halogeometricum borinquense DSM 11551]RYJ14636.1 trypsin-like serine protease [Halogeometricum borinquense]